MGCCQAVATFLNHGVIQRRIRIHASYRVYASTQIEIEGFTYVSPHVKKLMYTVNIGEPDVGSGTYYWSNSVAQMGSLPLPAIHDPSMELC
jgi:hypothetical protein